ncbi:hypothetical protein BAE44_0026081 [Dichanthelium oligosanthes]|uniref:Uncharacterized protein n=1 Tax=Dichanthelium oligosanthes TaxID=888268 RepID=A0A1E5UJ39_9POAL|nr:hypothetical protein BAE44_0026081 [Dichanthelium oligosanthes]
MASLQALFCATTTLLLLLVPHACTASRPSTVLQDACESYAAGDRSSYDYCVWKLRRDRGSATADARGLATIAARIARATARATGARIAGLQATETVPARCDGACAAAGQRSPLDGADRGLDDEVELAIALLPSTPTRA